MLETTEKPQITTKELPVEEVVIYSGNDIRRFSIQPQENDSESVDEWHDEIRIFGC